MRQAMNGESSVSAPLNVLIIANSINPEGRIGIGGAERLALDLASHFNRSLIEPSLLAYEPLEDRDDFLKSKKIAVHRIQKRWKFDPQVFLQLRRVIAENSIDAVLSVNTGANLDNLIATPQLKGIACMISVPSVRIKFRAMMTEGRIAYRADSLIVPSIDAEKVVSRQYRIPKSRIRVIPNGCDGERFVSVPYNDRVKYRSELGLPEDALVLYTPSRVHAIKGQDVFAEALAHITLEELRDKKVIWVNTGRIQDAKLAERIHSITRDVSDYVRFLPPASDTLKWYVACDWVVLPSRAESFGLSMLEAAFVGRPLYTSRCGIAKELDALHSGLTFDVGDVKSALDGLRLILSTSYEERVLITEKLGRHFRQKYSIESTVRQYEKAIVEAVRHRRNQVL